MNQDMREKTVELLIVFHLIRIKQHLKLKVRIIKGIQRDKYCSNDDYNCDRLGHTLNLWCKSS